MLAVNINYKCWVPTHHRSEEEMRPPGVSCLRLPGLPVHACFTGSVRPISRVGASSMVVGSQPKALQWRSALPSTLPPPGLPGAEVGGDGEDAGQGGDDTAHVGEEGQVVLVGGIHLHGGHLGPQDRSGLAAGSPAEGWPRWRANPWSLGGLGCL